MTSRAAAQTSRRPFSFAAGVLECGRVSPLLSSPALQLPPFLFAAAAFIAQASGILLLAYASHRWTLLLGLRRRPVVDPARVRNFAGPWPVVTVQLPIFNERLVVD